MQKLSVWLCSNCRWIWGLRWTHGVSETGVFVFALWGQLSTVNIFGYAPSQNTCFWIVIISAGYVRVWRWVIAHVENARNRNWKQTHEKQIEYFSGILQQERKQSLRDLLLELSNTLSFSMQERVCVYLHRPELFGFECAGRYSLHPEYDQPSERNVYPEAYGVFSHVWNNGQNNGKFRDESFPISDKKYLKYLSRKYAIPTEVAKKFRMNAKDIFAKIIRDSKSTPVAIIVFETQRKQFLNESLIESSYYDKEGMIIASLERLLAPINAPTLQSAKREDY